MIKRFNEFLNENDGGGVAMSTLGNTGSMGAVVAPTVGTTPGAVWGSGSGEKGSGDISATPGTYTKDNFKKKKKKKKKKDKISKLGEDYQNMYVTKFSEWQHYPEKKNTNK